VWVCACVYMCVWYVCMYVFLSSVSIVSTMHIYIVPVNKAIAVNLSLHRVMLESPVAPH